MRVLLLETDRHAGDACSDRLQAAGHRVVRCHEPDLDAFPCNALCGNGTCSLEAGAAIDVAVSCRAHPYPHPTLLEDGVSCALRHRIPLVVVGVSALNPFAPWTTEVADEADVVEACERAIGQPDRFLSDAATITVRDKLIRRGLDSTDASVTVTRRSGALRAAMSLDGDANEGELAVAVARVLRCRVPHARGIDVTAGDAPSVR